MKADGAGRPSRRFVVIGGLLALLTACEGRERIRSVEEFFAEASGPSRARPAAPGRARVQEKPAPDPEAMAAYERSRGEYQRGELGATQASLEEAVRIQDDFTEAWYNLGACRGNRALNAIRGGDEAAALSLFRAGVEAKRRARDLMADGVWYVYFTAGEQRQMREEVEASLEDADAVLEDEAALLAAMRQMAAGE